MGTMGLTKFAAGELGDVVYVGLPSVGAKFKAGDAFADVESVKSASQLYAPVGGTITEVRARGGVTRAPSVATRGLCARGGGIFAVVQWYCSDACRCAWRVVRA